MLCLPGLSRNARDFTDVATALSSPSATGPVRVIALELRGRGRSQWAPAETYTALHEMNDAIAALDQWGLQRVDLLGTSRGGLIAMLMAMQAPDRLRRVVLNDIGPFIEPSGLERIGGSIGNTMTFASYAALAQDMAERLGPQFTRLTPDLWERFARQLASENKDGGVTLDYDPALAEGLAGYTADQPTPDFWPAFDALARRPVLTIRGAHSDLLSAATMEAMRRRHGRMRSHVVAGEGHAPLLWDRPAIEAIRSFLT